MATESETVLPRGSCCSCQGATCCGFLQQVSSFLQQPIRTINSINTVLNAVGFARAAMKTTHHAGDATRHRHCCNRIQPQLPSCSESVHLATNFTAHLTHSCVRCSTSANLAGFRHRHHHHRLTSCSRATTLAAPHYCKFCMFVSLPMLQL